MKIFKWVEQSLFILSAVFVFASCQNVVEQNNTKTVGLEDPSVDSTVKSALENGSVSEVVVRKDLLLFPVNAPDLVIAHRQEIHAIPQNDSINEANGKPTAAEVAEVNEYSLSQLVSTNETKNESESDRGIPANVAQLTFLSDPTNDPVLEPGKLLEIVSGFNLSKGVSTETVPLPEEVQNISLPKQSIIDILSKPLAQQDSTATGTDAPMNYYSGKYERSAESYESGESEPTTSTTTALPTYTGIIDIFKRSADSDESDESASNSKERTTSPVSTDADKIDTDTSTEPMKRSVDSQNDSGSSKSTENSGKALSNKQTVKRSIDSDEDDSGNDSDSQESEASDSASTESSENADVTTDDNSDYSTNNIAKRSINSIEDMKGQISTSSDSSVYTTEEITKKSINSIEDMKKDAVKYSRRDSATSKAEPPIADSSGKYEPFIGENSEKHVFKGEEDHDMDVAEDIVFRPLFRYRQETRYRQEEARRRSNYRTPSYNGRNRYRYSDYD